MVASFSIAWTVNRAPLKFNGSFAGASLPSWAYLGKSLKKIKISDQRVSFGNFKVYVEYEEQKQTSKDRWGGLAFDTSDDQQDITRGKGMVDTLFQAHMNSGTHYAVLSSYDYLSVGLRQFHLDNTVDGLYIAPAFMDKLVVHITKNFLNLPNIKVPLILGIWGGKGQGKSFQCELVFAKMGINPITMSAGELESGNAGEPAKLIRQRYREATDIVSKGKMCCLFINDLDAGAGRMGGTTQYTVNNQMVNATLMNIADNPTNVQLPGMYNKNENPRLPIIVTGNDFSTLYAPLIRDGRMDKFYWAPTREDRIGVCTGIFRIDNVPMEDIVKLVDTFPGQSIGVAEIEKNGILILTNDTSRLMGRAIYSSPIKLKNSTTGKAFSFSTSFAFAIVPEYSKLGGHGFAFTIGPSKILKALPSQYLGLLTNASDNGNFSNHLFAVEFDTVKDFEFGDINDNHVGIDINGLKSNLSAPAAYYDETEEEQSKDVNLKSGKPIQAWIDYDSFENVLNVSISPFSKKPRLPLLSFKVDLSPIFHKFMYVGFSASTGLLASSHYIYGWSFAVNGQPQALDLDSLPFIPSDSEKKKKRRAITIGVSVSVIAFVLSAIAISIYIFLKIKNSDPIEAWELELGPHRYSYKELKQATKGFTETELLGSGGFGKVYKGTLPKLKTQIAVKRISHDSKQGLEEFVSEIASIGRLRHRNLVQLLGWCRRKSDLLLVYDFMSNGSLEKFLFEEPKMTLNWDQRFKIIKGVASALLYLHEGYEQIVLHRDVKASNVLLDDELNGRLGDFGLARLHEHGSNINTTRVVGTFGYLAPELPRTGKATACSDVFAFGALLLEVASGRRPIEPKAKPEELVLVDWVWKNYREGRVFEVVDSRLNEQFDEKEMLVVLKLGLMCSHNLPKARPNMRQLVRFLDGEVGVPDDLETPIGFDEDKANLDGFDDLMHSFASSSIDNMSTSHSFPENRYMDSSFTSPSIHQTRGETR